MIGVVDTEATQPDLSERVNVFGGAKAIEVLGVRKSFGKNVVLDGIDLAVSEGEVLVLIGPSGSGKSTLLRCIARLCRSTRARSRSEAR